MDNETNELEIPFDILPEAEQWKVGQTYRIKAVIKQTGASETGATFEIVDATSLEPGDKGKRRFMTEGGYLKM